MFGCTSDNISLHLKNIFAEEELDKDSVIEKISVTAADGKNYKTRHYNLDTIIAVGYRVNSKKATRFRQWATKTLKEYIQKGFVPNDELMKNGRPFGKDYFDELLERIQEIQASERRAYQKIADIFEQCSYDYDKNSETTKIFYEAVWAFLLPKADEMEASGNQAIFSQMVSQAEFSAENGELLYMRDWFSISNNCITQERSDRHDRTL